MKAILLWVLLSVPVMAQVPLERSPNYWVAGRTQMQLDAYNRWRRGPVYVVPYGYYPLRYQGYGYYQLDGFSPGMRLYMETGWPPLGR